MSPIHGTEHTLHCIAFIAMKARYRPTAVLFCLFLCCWSHCMESIEPNYTVKLGHPTPNIALWRMRVYRHFQASTCTSVAANPCTLLTTLSTLLDLCHHSGTDRDQNYDNWLDLKSYRPDSNLSFRLLTHCDDHQFILPYSPSTDQTNETIQQKRHLSALSIRSHTFHWQRDNGDVCSLVLLDLSAAFDTVDHRPLLNVMHRHCSLNICGCSRPRSLHLRPGINSQETFAELRPTSQRYLKKLLFNAA